MFRSSQQFVRGLCPQPRMRSISTLGVVGAGQMGSGIGFVGALHANLNVVLVDSKQEQLDKAMSYTASLLKKQVAREKITQARADEVMGKFSTSTSMSGLNQADFVVEAVSENIDLKKKIFSAAAQETRGDVILATNTSSISITKLQHKDVTDRPEKIIGMHFMNPVPVMKLVEIISGLRTSQETLDTTLDLADSMGKVCSRSKDIPGFIANRILMPYINEAAFVLEHGIATREDIDLTMKQGTNVPMGPLTLADFIGLDTCLYIMQVLHRELGDSKYRPSPLLQQYVDAGLLGVKSGQGFYKYENGKRVD